MEDLAHLDSLQGAWIPTKNERFLVLKQLDDEVKGLYRTYVRRKTKSVESADLEIPAPYGYDSFRDYLLMGIVDRIFVPGCCAEYLDVVNGLIRRRDQLRTYAAHRAGKPENRYQNPAEWEIWSKGIPLPKSCGSERALARGYFLEGDDYEWTLWEVANQWMMTNGQLDRRHAVAIKKSVDRAYFDVFQVNPPPAPRGWWHPEKDLGLSPGGLPEMGLAWVPSTKADSQRTEPTIPYHIRVQWMLEFSCWKDDPQHWP